MRKVEWKAIPMNAHYERCGMSRGKLIAGVVSNSRPPMKWGFLSREIQWDCRNYNVPRIGVGAILQGSYILGTPILGSPKPQTLEYHISVSVESVPYMSNITLGLLRPTHGLVRFPSKRNCRITYEEYVNKLNGQIVQSNYNLGRKTFLSFIWCN